MAGGDWPTLERQQEVARALGVVSIHGIELVAARISGGRVGGDSDFETARGQGLRGVP